jgi:phage-related baseplate assembly protein
MSIFSNIDFDALPLPDVIEEVSFEDELAYLLADETNLHPGDPGYALAEKVAYALTLIRARVNASARALMRRYAQGNDLVNLAAGLEVQRKVIDPGDPDAIPPIEPVLESLESLRRRTWMARSGLSAGGAIANYEALATADQSLVGRVRGVNISQPQPGVVRVAVSSVAGDGTADVTLIGDVKDVLSQQDAVPYLDTVDVDSAQAVTYSIEAELIVFPNQDNDAILAAANAALLAYCESRRKPGYSVTLAGISKALMVAGVVDVSIIEPPANVTVGADQSSYCGSVVTTIGGIGV